MNRDRGLRAGIVVLLILTGCAKNKTLDVEGAYSPVIENLSSDYAPAVRGEVNALTAVVTNPRSYTLKFHWSAGAGTLLDSTMETVHWTAPDVIGVYPVTVSVEATDSKNSTSFFKTRTFQVAVDNEFERWTRSVALQLDVVPPTAGRIYYTEILNPSTGQSDIWAVASPLGAPEQITRTFFQATSPTAQSDGSRVAFVGRRRSSDTGSSIWLVPPTGGDTITALLAVKFDSNKNANLSGPRFAPSGSRLLYDTDSVSFGVPRPWVRDVGNFATAPIQILLYVGAEGGNAYVNAAWSGAGDSIVAESYRFYRTISQTNRGLYRLSATSNPVTPYPQWLADGAATEPDWSPDGEHVVYVKRVQGRTDRDVWIIRSDATSPSAAVLVTSGPADDFHPRFSSDGSKIFFVSNRADYYGVNGVYGIEQRGTNIWSVSGFDLP